MSEDEQKSNSLYPWLNPDGEFALICQFNKVSDPLVEAWAELNASLLDLLADGKVDSVEKVAELLDIGRNFFVFYRGLRAQPGIGISSQSLDDEVFRIWQKLRQEFLTPIFFQDIPWLADGAVLGEEKINNRLINRQY